MSMGIVNSDEFEKEISINSPKESGQVKIIEKGRGNGNVEVPNTLRKVIGEESETNGRQAAIELGQRFGISSSSVSAYANGSTSTKSYDETPNKPYLNNARIRISDRARKKLSLALSHITPDKFDTARLRDISGVAKDMSAIIKNLEPQVESSINEKQSPQIILFAPTIMKEESFEVIYAKD